MGRLPACFSFSTTSSSFRRISTFYKKVPFPGDEVIIPTVPTSSQVPDVGRVPKFSHSLITHLERLSLVRFPSEQAVANLRESVRLANKLQHVDITGISPMHTVWEESECVLRRDEVQHSEMTRNEVLSNCAKKFEDYFVTPPGNLPLEATADKLDLKLINQWDLACGK